MSKTLWKLHLSRHVDGFVSGPVASVLPDESLHSGRVGRYSPAECQVVAPDPAAMRECLPYRYRKAWDRRAADPMWHPWQQVGSEHAGASHIRLNDSKGRYLNTVYAFPYIFQANGGSDV